ncbi:efflux RND transporter periplasmic adaptor subunit [Desulfitibacter alkalitolerans]|uniref:efflux RND transporter periplasmic adaptor subunit n=1 Tax=Desulfitibacter alkalitolerans TaxID=264641 RepID=UPI0004844B5A|nr:efflux RND transporter periplasmic adaptor subunit [Desulfitibacter alkalitolerans]
MREKKILIAFFMVIAVIAAVVAAGSLMQSVEEVGETDVINPIPVETAKAFRGDITEITNMTAVVEARDSVSVIPKLGGKVERVAVSVGDRVSKGQVLVQLEQRELLDQLKQAEAGLALAQAGKSSAMARLDDARATLERMEKLYTEGAISKQQLDQARLQYQLSDPETVNAQIKQAQAGVDMIRTQLENTIISAPITGVVTAVNVSAGEMAGPSMPVAVIMNLDEVEISVGVVEQYINNVKVGDKVDLRISAVKDEPYTGVIKTIAPAADQMNRTFPVTIILQNENHEIKAGMFAEVALATRTKQDVVVVPMVAVVDQGSRQSIFVVENNEAVARKIELGINDGQFVEVISGIEEGETLIIKGQNIVTHGDPVVVQGGEK